MHIDDLHAASAAAMRYTAYEGPNEVLSCHSLLRWGVYMHTVSNCTCSW